MSSKQPNLTTLLADVRQALNDWISARRVTIEITYRVINKLKYRGKFVNGVKLGSNTIGALSGFTTGAIGIAAIASSGGLATPFVIAGAAAGIAGLSSAVAAGGAEVAKSHLFSQLILEVKKALQKEFDKYQTAIENLKKLSKVITEKNFPEAHLSQEIPWSKTLKYVGDASVKVEFYSNVLYNYYAPRLGHAASEKAWEMTRLAANASESSSVEVISTACSKAAADEFSGLTGSVFFGNMSREAVDTMITKAGTEAASKAISEGGKELTKDALEKSTISALRFSNPATKVAGDSILDGFSNVFGSAMNILGPAVLPTVNFVFAIWDAAEAVKAGKDLKWGSKEENILREMVEQLKQEANEAVEWFNYKAKTNQMEIPFPAA